MTLRKLVFGAAGLAVAYAAVRKSRIAPLEGVKPVEQFDISRYLGKWYEVGRLENRFERGLVRTTAEYSMNANGTVRVVNRGFDTIRLRQKEATATAKFVGDESVGALKVSFFWPFYGGYNVIDLDPEYRWAIVVGSSRKYFWVLSRDPVLPEALRSRAELAAFATGIDPKDVFWVPQE